MNDRGYTYTEEWRRICEARYVLKLPTLAARRDYLAKVESRRGVAACNELKAEMMKQHKPKGS